MAILLSLTEYNRYSVFLMVNSISPEFGERPSAAIKKNNQYPHMEQMVDIPRIILYY